MRNENIDILSKDSILDDITRTLLYEGYSLFPYHRTAIKNQKPIPFGVVYPTDYNIFNTHAHSNMQTECIVTGDENLIINISVRFLHLKKIQIVQKEVNESEEDNFVPAFELNLNGDIFQPGWQTIERKLDSGDLSVLRLMEKSEIISFKFDRDVESISLCDENGEIAAKQINSILGMQGAIVMKASAIENNENAFRIHVSITNDTPVEDAKEVSRDEIFNQSFLSTNIILNAVNGKFISVQNPGIEWGTIIEQCHNRGTWPILIDETDTTLLSSPIIVYDYPKINPRSHGDLFDSLEIEEALMLHFSVMSDDEKQKISQSDDKLRSMLTKVGQVTPEEIINLHGGFSNTNQTTIHSKKE
ncbi:MAG TPA: hypothetical protein VGP55_09290 [Chitinophagaceae bacterium]|nr:hypothetical protein [Chitinophagaceae bacterium]